MRPRPWLLAAIALLYLVSVPWYREPGGTPGVVLGLPDWVAVALGCYVAAAVLNAVAWLCTEVDDAPDDPASDERSES